MDKTFCGKIILPDNPLYDTARQEYNRSIQRYPGAIAYCRSVEDIRRAVCWARKHGVTVRIRSGGHNYQGFSVGNGILVIDVSCLKEKSIDTQRGTVRIGSGVNNGELYALVGERGYPFPSGTCPTVGAAGLTLGGGWGLSARMFGLTCDSLLSIEMVDANGDLIKAGRSLHPSLFWASRGGGGGNFGVVTALSYRLPPRFFEVTLVNITYPRASGKTAERLLCTWQDWLATADNRFTPQSRIYHTPEGMNMTLRGIYYGDPYAAYRALKPFLRIPGAQEDLRATTFWEAAQAVAETYPPYQRFRFIGRFVYERYSACQIETIVSLIRQRPAGGTVSLALYALGGRVRDIAPTETAFFYRDAHYILGLEADWERPADADESILWLRTRAPYLRSITRGSYVNFPYQPIPCYMNAYYGGNACRLRCVKRRYDPCDLFRFPQGIR